MYLSLIRTCLLGVPSRTLKLKVKVQLSGEDPATRVKDLTHREIFSFQHQNSFYILKFCFWKENVTSPGVGTKHAFSLVGICR